MGKSVKKSWFNLKHQGIQPSTPSREGFFTHFYDDAFDGVSSLSLDTTELIRLFVCELTCDDDVIFSYTFKRKYDSNDLTVNLNLLDLNTNAEVQLVFDGFNGANPCLPENDVRKIAVFLANKHQSFIPSFINGWETRYYLLKFHKSNKMRITDIGVKKMKRGSVLLGNMAFYSAQDLKTNEFAHINTVQL